MYGAQGPGGSRSRAAGRRVYVRRRILAVLVVLLLLALLIPRACQALLGSDEDTGSREDRKTGAAETATGAGSDAKNADTEKTGTKDASSDRGIPYIDKGGTGGEDAPGAEDGDEATPDLAAMVAELAIIGGDEEPAVEDVAAAEPGADQTAQRPASIGAGSELQDAPETSRVPAGQPPSDNEGAPTSRRGAGPSGTAAPAANPPGERVRSGGDLVATAPVAARYRFGGVRARPPEPVVNAPVAPAPTPVTSDIAFVAGGGSVAGGTGGLANNFGGAVNGATAFNGVGTARGTPAVIGAGPAPVALSGGPRRAVTGPIKTPRSAVF